MNWIKVTDALPEEGERVLVWDGGKWVYGSFIIGKFFTYISDKALTVTHWMRITPPEE